MTIAVHSSDKFDREYSQMSIPQHTRHVLSQNQELEASRPDQKGKIRTNESLRRRAGQPADIENQFQGSGISNSKKVRHIYLILRAAPAFKRLSARFLEQNRCKRECKEVYSLLLYTTRLTRQPSRCGTGMEGFRV